MLDKDTGVGIQEILDDLKWQSNQLQKVLVDNIKTFQTSYFDLQSPLCKIKNIDIDLTEAKKDLILKFDKIWNFQDNDTFDDDLMRDLETPIKNIYTMFETATKELIDFMNMLTKKFKDREYKIYQVFTEQSLSKNSNPDLQSALDKVKNIHQDLVEVKNDLDLKFDEASKLQVNDAIPISCLQDLEEPLKHVHNKLEDVALKLAESLYIATK